MFFPRISSVLIFAMFLVMIVCLQIFWWRCFFTCFGRDFSSDVFFVDMYFPIFLLGKCLLRDFFGRGFLFNFLQGMSLQSFLGRIF